MPDDPSTPRPRTIAGVPVAPKNPERICWGCPKFCPAHELACGNGTIRAPHPAEIFGDDWLEWVSQKPSPRSET